MTAAMTRFSRRQRRYLAEWLFLVAALLVLGAYMGYSLYQDYIRIEGQERERLTSRAIVIEKNLVPRLYSANRAIEGVVEDLRSRSWQIDGLKAASLRLRRITETLTGVRGILITDATGRVLSSSNPEMIGQDLSRRDYFRIALKDPNPGILRVAPPFQSVLGQYVMALYRIIPGANGEFAGIVLASLEPQYFTDLLDSVRNTPDATTSMIHGDGKLFTLVPERGELRGRDLAVPGSFFTTHRNSGQQASVFAGTSYLTGTQRLIAFRTIQPASLAMDKPLVVSVSRDFPSIFAAWNREARIEGGLFGVVVLVASLSLFFYQQRQRALEGLADAHEQERSQVEADLRIAATSFEAHQGIVVTDANSIIIRVNRAFTEITGYTPEETIGKKMSFLGSGRQDKAFYARMWQTIRSQGTWEGEIWNRRSNGELHPHWVTIAAVKASHDVVTHYVGTYTDITERKQQEERIHRLLTENATILDNALVGIVYLKQRRIVSCNRRFEDIFQYDHGELTGESTARLYDSRETFDHIGVVAYRAAAEGNSYTGEVRLQHKDGSLFWGTLSGRAVDPAQPHEGSIWIYTDITELKLAETDLRIAAVAFDSQEAIMITDAKSVILKVNKAFTETTGYAAGDVVGQTPRLLQSGRHDADFYRAMWSDIHRTGGWQGEVWDRRRNGEEYPKWLTISAVKDNDGVVTHYVGAQFDISERKQAEQKIHELAFFDQLTGLPNRTLLQDRLKQTMTASGRSGSYGALLFLDLDNFKELNDTLGHDVGDLLLKQVAHRLTQCVREGDSVARIGGDEFVVILANLGTSERAAANGTEIAAEKILATLNQVYRFGAAAHHSTASIGATLFNSTSISIDDLMKQADLTMYKAKEAGRNKIRFFDPAMEVAVKQRAGLESDLRRAVEARQFVLHFQPQVVGGGRVTGAEALVRWQHPQRGMVSPAEFIPLAEETGLILPLGSWVLETACRQLATWAKRPEMAHLTLAVNVSAHQFRQTDFVEQVLATLKDSGANPERLKLELTESLLVANVEDIVEKMFALKSKGVRFSLDDFGTGFSSLSYLKRLPLDQLKIDQSFVRDVLSDPNDAAIARTVVALANSLGLGVIAEGVETEPQREFLAGSGCHAYQGYLFSKPLPLDRFEAFLPAAATGHHERQH